MKEPKKKAKAEPTVLEKARHKTAQEAITDEELNKILKDEVDNILSILDKDPHDSWMPRLLPFVRQSFNKPLDPIAAVFIADMPDNDRRKLFNGLGLKLSEDIFFKEKPAKIPVAVLFSSEAWQIERPLKKNEKRVSEAPDKSEIIFIAGQSIDGRTNMARIKIKRGAKKRIQPTLDLYQPYKFGQTMKSHNNLVDGFYEGIARYISKRDSERKQPDERNSNA